jgi:Leucine-rich repeat (LRR) protein
MVRKIGILFIFLVGIVDAVSIKDLVDNNKIFALKHIWVREGGRFIDIDLSNMGITSLDGFYYLVAQFNINPAKIHDFCLSNNKIKKIPPMFLDSCYYLQRLWLDNNIILELPNKFLEKNQYLNGLELSHNQLKALPKGFLANNTHLKILNLSHNRLFELPSKFLYSCSELVSLFLDHNNVYKFPKNFLHNNKKLQYLTVHNNPFIIEDVSFPEHVIDAL